MSETMLAVTGMTCIDCAHHVEQALRSVSGVRNVRVEYPKGVARIDSEFPLAIDTLNAALPKSYRVKSLSAEDALEKARPSSSLLGKALGAFGGSRRARAGSETPLITTSELTCPNCGHISRETMPTDACIYFYECAGCRTLLRPRARDCCVFCSYGSVPCPPVQANQSCCGTRAADER
jgi:copper chaperone CopZ